MIRNEHLQAALRIWGERAEETVCTIAGNCMSPLVRDGDSVIIEHGCRNLRPGDILVLGVPGDFRIQRLVRVIFHQGQAMFIVKGDQSEVPLPPVPENEIVGKVVAAHGSHGHVRFDTIFWRMINYLLWLRSYAGECRIEPHSAVGRVVSAVFHLRTALLPSQYSLSLLPIRVLCWAGKFGKRRTLHDEGIRAEESGIGSERAAS